MALRLYHICQLPTSVTEIPVGSKGVHESCLRAYQIVEKVKTYLDLKYPHDVILELINIMEHEECVKNGGEFHAFKE